MNTSTESLIKLFAEKLLAERINPSKNFEADLIRIYNQLLELFSKEYNSNRFKIANFMGHLEDNNRRAIAYSMLIFRKLYNKVITQKNTIHFDSSFINDKIMSEETSDKFFSKLTQLFKESKEMRISTFAFKDDDFTNDERIEIVVKCQLLCPVRVNYLGRFFP